MQGYLDFCITYGHTLLEVSDLVFDLLSKYKIEKSYWQLTENMTGEQNKQIRKIWLRLNIELPNSPFPSLDRKEQLPIFDEIGDKLNELLGPGSGIAWQVGVFRK